MKNFAYLLVLGACGFHGSGDKLSTDAPPTDDAPGNPIDTPHPDGQTIDPDGTESCANYIMVGSSKYFPSATTKSWYDAEAACEADGAHLAIPNDPTELSLILPIMGGSSFIGITDIRNMGDWLDVTGGVAAFLPWKPNEPSQGAKDHCVLLIKGGAENGKYDAVDCMPKTRYLCECDGIPADRNAYTREE